MDWRAFWNGRHSIYVNDRHRTVHYTRVADDIIALVRQPDAIVLDYGCGEALFAARVAERCGRLYLSDAAPTVREKLAARHAGDAKIAVLAPDDVARLPDGSLDLVVSNSVLQYLTVAEFEALARMLRPITAFLELSQANVPPSIMAVPCKVRRIGMPSCASLLLSIST